MIYLRSEEIDRLACSVIQRYKEYVGMLITIPLRTESGMKRREDSDTYVQEKP